MFVAGPGRISAAGCWLLAAGCWLLALSGQLSAADDAAQAAVATVAGTPISLGDCELHLLRREGAESVGEIARSALDGINWAALGADDAILTLASGRIARADLVADLLPRHRDQITEERINIAVVRSELERRGIVIDPALIRAEIARADRKLQEGLEARGMARMALDDYLREAKQVSLEQWTAQDGFRFLIAGLHALVRAECAEQLGEDELRRRFESERERFVEHEAVDCSVIFLPYRSDAAGNVPDVERDRLAGVVAVLREQIANGRTTFAKTFATFARSYDPAASADGRVGWIGRDGRRGRADARVLPPPVVAAAFACTGPFPALLDPVAHEAGIDLVLVHGWRPRRDADFAAQRDRLLEELVERELDQRAKALLVRLRQAAPLGQAADGSITVGTRVVTPREIEDAILAAHGKEAAQQRLATLLERLPWEALPADRPVLAGRGWAVERATLVVKLLERGAAQVREDLIGIAVLRHAVAAAGIVVDAATIEAEIERLRRAYARSSEAARRDFEGFVRRAYGASLANLRQDAAFRALAGCAELLRRRAAPTDDEVAVFFAANRAAYRQDAAVDLTVLFLPHLPADGLALTEADRERTRKAAGQMHGMLAAGKASFVELWEHYGKRHDPLAQAGSLGWIPRSGVRPHPQAKPVPEAIMTAAFAAPAPHPRLLDVVDYGAGMALVEVRGRRDQRDPPLDAIRDRVVRDCLEATWDERLTRFVEGLRRDTEVVYEDLPPLIEARKRELGL